MQLPVSWYEAIIIRRSRRQFTSTIITEDILKRLEHTCNNFKPFEGVRAVLVTSSPDNVFKGAIGPYGKVRGASAYIAFIGDQTIDHVAAKVGYLGEGLILQATILGLATCWVGGMFDAKAVKRHITLSENEKIFAVTPVGYAAEKHTFEEKILSGLAKSDNRKSLSEIAPNYDPQKWPQWATQGLKSAKLAPSAVNRQPWRFRYEDDSVVISVDNPKDTYHIPKELDCGIAMLHFEVSASLNGGKGTWEFLNSPDVVQYVTEKA